ncbi:MAG TPA: FAD-binding and (Fe-S)-binding domain-containing protein [Blastocatellia bacterium]|nr:FAD-binding and (Fe-S)-binding domain-containing protein [Blastocatellia bacterium]
MATAIRIKTPPTQFHHHLQTGVTRTITVDAAALEHELRSIISGEVRFSDGDRALYSADASNYRQVPIGVVIPKSREDVIQTVAACRRYGAPILARGGGTGIPGQSVNVAVMIDFSKYLHNVIGLNPEKKLARVEPGCVLDTLRDAAERHHLTFGPDPATHNRNTLGGMVGNNSCGIHSVMAGRTSDNIEELEILTYDGTQMRVGRTSDQELVRIIGAGGRRGEIYAQLKNFRDRYADLIRQRFPRIPRRVSGYNLPELLPENGFNVARALVGSECTCVMVLEITAQLVPSPPVRSLLVLGYPDIFAAGDHVTEVLRHKPTGLEGLDDEFILDMKKKGMHPKNMELMPEGKAWLLAEFGGDTREEADEKARRLMAELKRGGRAGSMKLFDDPKQERVIWNLREEGLGATARIPGEPDNHEGWEDSAVPPDRLGHYLRGLHELLEKYDYHGPLYGHFGDGCVHTRLTFDLETADGIRKFRSFLEEAADLVVSHGGSFSGEHGDGQARGELLPKMFGDEMVEAFHQFKAIWDPEWKMNPGKLVAPYRVDENLRWGVAYHPPELKTHFQFPDDRRSFAYAAERCVGAGVCRRHAGGTMCPSYMVTLEEKHSTRGRARLLSEMLRGDPVRGGWQSEAVKEALDLCLACKGCRGECPVQVDMATYKAEFLSHYYEGRLRPRTAWTMGHIHLWARLAALAPRLANFFTHAPVFGTLAKAVAGIHPNREIPAFAPYTFKQWFRRRGPRNDGRPRVILWADTFNNHFHPQTAEAALEVLEAADFRAEVPMMNLCCGRPLHDWGMLDEAKGLLRQTLDALKGPIEAGVPVVVLEPSCASVFRDELVNFFPDDENAKRLSQQTFLLGEFLNQKAPHFRPPQLNRGALVHGHCHHKSIMKMDDDEAVFNQLGLDFATPDSGCCGMAGAFGFERGDHYDVAMKCGERVLLPAVREAGRDTIIIADGFSCREQIAQATDRHALHLAQIIQMAMREGPGGPAGTYPEADYINPRHNQRSNTTLKAAALAGAGMLIVGAFWWGLKRMRR